MSKAHEYMKEYNTISANIELLQGVEGVVSHSGYDLGNRHSVDKYRIELSRLRLKKSMLNAKIRVAKSNQKYKKSDLREATLADMVERAWASPTMSMSTDEEVMVGAPVYVQPHVALGGMDWSYTDAYQGSVGTIINSSTGGSYVTVAI